MHSEHVLCVSFFVYVYAWTGLGNCMLRIMSVLALNEIAQENFNILFSLATCGFAAGMVILPLLAATLVGPYGWRGGVLVLGAMMGNILPCACFNIKRRDSDPPSTSTSKKATSTQLCTALEDAEKEHSCDSTKVGGNQGDHEETCLVDRNIMESTNHRESLPLTPEEDDKSSDSPLSPLVSKSYVSLIEITIVIQYKDKLAKHFRESHFYKDPFFILVTFSTFCQKITYTGWHGFLIPHALQRGISLNHTIIITFCASVGNLIGRFLGGFLSHRLVTPLDTVAAPGGGGGHGGANAPPVRGFAPPLAPPVRMGFFFFFFTFFFFLLFFYFFLLMS